MNFNANTVTLLDATTGAVLGQQNLPAGPAATAINTANGHLYVSNEIDKSISALDGATLAILSTVKLPLVAFFMEVDEAEGRIYTSGGNTGDESGTMVLTDVLGKLGIDVSVTASPMARSVPPSSTRTSASPTRRTRAWSARPPAATTRSPTRSRIRAAVRRAPCRCTSSRRTRSRSRSTTFTW